jgi:anthranilate phosphoribosyltransferase
MVVPLACALQKLGCEEAMVVHGLDGLDEVSTVGKTAIAHLRDGEVKELEVSPQSLGVQKASVADLQCVSAEESAQTIIGILKGKERGVKADIVLVNSAAGIIVGGKASDFKEAVELARASIALCSLWQTQGTNQRFWRQPKTA